MNFRETVAQNTAGSISFEQWKLKKRGAVICRGSFSELVMALCQKGSLPVPTEVHFPCARLPVPERYTMITVISIRLEL